MLDFMRRHAQSWMIKVAIAAIAIVFISWGVWAPRGSREREVVKIYDQTITVPEVRNYYQNLRERYQMVYRDKFTDEMAKKLGLKEQAIKEVLNRVLLLHEAHRLDLTVAPKELQGAIEKYPVFQKEGHFHKATYVGVLQRMRMNPQEFEASEKQRILITKVQNLLTSSVTVSDQEILDNYREIFEKVNLDVISISPSTVKDVSLTPQEEKDYFSKHLEDFKIPAKVKVRYLLFDPKDYAKKVEVTPKEIESYYQGNQDKFGQPKRLKVRHILIRADVKDAKAAEEAKKKAESIREEAIKDKDFSKLAKKYSDDPGTKDKGGDLGYISRGQVVPEFEEAAFSMKPGEISKVVQTPYGFHILRVDEIQEPKVEPLEKVKDQIISTLRTRKSREIAYDEADQAFALASREKNLDGVAKEKNLHLKETPLFSPDDKIDLAPKLKEAALSMSKGDISPVLRVEESYAVLQVLDKQEPRIPELKEVQGKVSEALLREKQKEKALAKANELLEKLKKGGDLKSQVQHEGFQLEETGFFERGGGPQKISPTEELRNALLTLTPKDPYVKSPLHLDGKVYIFRLKDKKDIDLEKFKEQKENYRRAFLQQKQERVLMSWLTDLLEQAKNSGNYKEYQNVNEVI